MRESGISLIAIASVIIMIIGPLITRPLLHLLNTPESIIDWCQAYLTIIFVALFIAMTALFIYKVKPFKGIKLKKKVQKI